jgi:hypothetical protein
MSIELGVVNHTMSLVLAIEPDAAQAAPLTALVRAKLGAQLQLVASSHAALIAMNQRPPDVVLIGRDLSQDERTKIVTHLRSVTAEGAELRIVDIPELSGAASDSFTRNVGACLTAAEGTREAKASVVSELSRPASEPSAPAPASTTDESIRAADVSLIEAEVEFRLKSELERLQAEAARQQARELVRVETEAAERRTREMARVEAEAARQRALELARIEEQAASLRKSAVAEARAAAEAAAREALTAELERVRREGEDQLAAEVRRIRNEAEQLLATKLALAQAQAERDREERNMRARAEADAAKAAAMQEARRVVEQAAARAKMAEDEVERVRSEADAQLKAAVAKARAESDAQLQEQVARAKAETEARLEAQLASVIGQAEQFQHAQREMTVEADKIRMEAAEKARAAAEAALASETARIRAEANERLEAEIRRLRIEAARARTARADERPLFASSMGSERPSGFADISRAALRGIRWDFVATAALILLVVVAGALYLPHAMSTAARTSTVLVGTAGKAAKAAAKEAVTAAPSVTRRAITAAERAIPHPDAVNATTGPQPAAVEAAAATAPPADSGPGFMTVFSRIPMQVYVDGKRIGMSDDGQLLLPSGTHRIEVVNEHFHYRSSTTLTIRPGHVQPYNVVLPTAQIHVTTTPGAEVWVEGERVGVAPLGQIQVPIGTREIAVKDATGEKQQVVEVKYGDALEVSLVPQASIDERSPATPRLAPLMRSR